jgi:hypothetical protein
MTPAPAGLTIVNPNQRYSGLALSQPPPTGYLHLAAVIEPTIGPTPLPRPSLRKRRLLSQLKDIAGSLAGHDAVSRVTVYRAALIPPPARGASGPAAHAARYDVAVLIETVNLDALAEVQNSHNYLQLHDALSQESPDVLTMPARCTRLIADVEKTRQGLYLFNYFTAADPDVALGLWEHLAAWYETETGMDNSTLLAPLADSDYVFVNHARWQRNLASFMTAQFNTPTFRSYVLANLRANHTASTPILFHLA